MLFEGFLLDEKAEIAVNNYGVTQGRKEVVDYMMVHAGAPGYIYIKNPEETFDMGVYLKPLRTKAWMGVATFFILTPISMTIIMLFSKCISKFMHNRILLFV